METTGRETPGKTVAIMQPYFFPYIGYFRLIAGSDLFVVYDDVQYIKGGWANRNRIEIRGEPHFLTMPVEQAPLHSTFLERQYKSDQKTRGNIVTTVRQAYARAPFAAPIMLLIEQIMAYPDPNVGAFNRNLIERICEYIGVETEIVGSSELDIDRSLRGEQRVIAICKKLGATRYLNSPGGRDLYSPEAFEREGIELSFLEPSPPSLSIIDTLMHHSVEDVRQMLGLE